MSTRIRTIKPEWLEDEQLAEAGTLARLLSVSLIVLADDHGRGRANEIVLAAKVFTYEKDPVACLREALASLSRIRFIELYEVRGQRYYQIRNWAKHQKVDRPSKPRFPGPDEAGGAPPPSTDPGPGPTSKPSQPPDSRDTRDGLAPDRDLDQGPVPVPRPTALAREHAPQQPRPRNLAKVAWAKADIASGGTGETPASHDQELLALSQQAAELAATIPNGDASESLEKWARDFLRTARKRHVAVWIAWCSKLSAAGNLRPVAKLESVAEASARIAAKREAERVVDAAPPPEALRNRFKAGAA